MKTTLFDGIRRGPGVVEFPSPNARLGNLLYLWMHTWLEQAEGADMRTLVTPATEPWRRYFVGVDRDLLVDRSDIRYTDRRVSGAYQAVGVHYTAEQLESFCRAYLLDSELINLFSARLEGSGVGSFDSVTINVRRGDYYSVPEYTARYGFDVVSYVSEALQVQQRRHPVTEVHIVSDDLAWCQEHLDLGRREVHWFDDRGPELDLATLMTSRRLVLTNSTFSYWGGYAAQTRYSDAFVVAPVFHARDWLGGRSFHLHPSWIALPGYGEVKE